MKLPVLLPAAAFAIALSWSPVHAQFIIGPSQGGAGTTVAQANDARLGSSVTLTGHISAHIRENYYTFRDTTGEIRVEIEDGLWQGRKVGSEDTIRLVAEVDRDPIRGRYLWVESLAVVD